MLRCKRKNHTRSSISTTLGLHETIGMLGHWIHQCLLPLKAEKINVFKVKGFYSYKQSEALQNLRPSSLELLISPGILKILPLKTTAWNTEPPALPSALEKGYPAGPLSGWHKTSTVAIIKPLGAKQNLGEQWDDSSRARALKLSWDHHLSQTYPLNNNRSPQPFPPSPKPINTLGIIHTAGMKNTHHRNNFISRCLRCTIKSVI